MMLDVRPSIPAQEIVCHGHSPSQKSSQDDSSLFPSILKLLVRSVKDCMAPTGKINASTKLAFQLVTNIAVLSDCRGLIWKVLKFLFPIPISILKYFYSILEFMLLYFYTIIDIASKAVLLHIFMREFSFSIFVLLVSKFEYHLFTEQLLPAFQ